MQGLKKNNSLKEQNKAKKRTVLPFNKQLIDLQKKIQQVEDKNQRILQQIHKAYNFKKKKIYYDTAGHTDGRYEQNQYQQENGQQYEGDQIQPQAQNVHYSQNEQFYPVKQFVSSSPSRLLNPQSPSPYPTRYFQSTQLQNLQLQKPQKYDNRQSLNEMVKLKDLQTEFQLQNSQLNQHQTEQQEQEQESSNGQIQFKSSSNYSDVEKRRRINLQAKKRENDFSDIKSSIEKRRLKTDFNDPYQIKQHNIKRSFVYRDVENNSLYSEGHVHSKQHHEADDLQIVEVPVTSYPISARRDKKRPNYIQAVKYVSSRQNSMAYSTQQIFTPQPYVTQNKIPVSPVSNQQRYASMRHSAYIKNPPYQQQQVMSQTQISFLQQMFRTQRQKTLILQQEISSKDQKILNLKKYKKNFKNFINNTYYVIQEAFDQYVEYFLKNRLYQLEKMVRKNENRLAALFLTFKDLIQERSYHKSLKRNLQIKSQKRNYHSIENIREKIHSRPEQIQNASDQNNFQQNRSEIVKRSRQRSISASKRPSSRDKSLTKKSNQSHLMKKQFKNIADKYEAMLKIKNDQIQKHELQMKQTKKAIQALEQENNKLKQNIQISTSNVDSSSSDQGRRNSGNLRILSRSSSKTQLKKNVNSAVLAQQNQQLSQKIKKYQKQIQKISDEKSELQVEIQQARLQNSKIQNQIKQAYEKISNYQNKQNHLKLSNNKRAQEQKVRLQRCLEQSTAKSAELTTQVETLRYQLSEKDKKISQMDSSLYLKGSQIKKLQNLLTLKSYKLQQFNKLLLAPSANQSQNLNDSISSIIDDPQNKQTFMLLQNLQKQLEDQKQQKQLQFLKLKKTYESKIEQLKIQFEEILLQNERLDDRLKQEASKKRIWETQREQFSEDIQELKQEMEVMQKQLLFYKEKISFYEAQRQIGRTASFVDTSRRQLEGSHRSNNRLDYMKQTVLDDHDLEDFQDEQNSTQKQKNVKLLQSWKEISGQIQLLQQSSLGGTVQQNANNSIIQIPSQLKKVVSVGQNTQQTLSLIKEQNIQLSQKVAKLQKQNKFLKQAEIEQAKKVQNLKAQLQNFISKYEQLQNDNTQLFKMVEDMQKQKHHILASQRHVQGTSPFDWKQVENTIEPVQLKGSGMYGQWNFAQKDDFLLDKSKDFEIRESIVSNFNVNSNRPSRQSIDKKIEELTKRLAETQVILENKQKMNEQLIIGFSKKIDNLTTQIEQQAKVNEKYIQQNSKLRKQKQKLQEDVETLQQLISQNKSKQKKQQSENSHKNESFKSAKSQDQQIEIEQNNLEILEQRIDFFQIKGAVQEYEPAQFSASQNARAMFEPMLQQEIELENLEQKTQKIDLLQKQVQQLQQTIEQLQKFLKQMLIKVKLKQQEKVSIVQQLKKKNEQVEQLRDLIQLKQAGKNTLLASSKYIKHENMQRPSLEKSDRPPLYSVNNSLRYSQTNQGLKERKGSFQEEINFQFIDYNPNHSITLENSHLSGIYSENMSMIFEKEQNFLDQIKRAKNKRKQEGKLLKNTFQYIKKLRAAINSKNKRLKLLENRLKDLKDNCWLWKKKIQNPSLTNPAQYTQFLNHNIAKSQADKHQGSGIQLDYMDHNQSLSNEDKDKLVDSRLFECNSQDLNKKKPHRHNHYKKLEFDTKLIAEENKILTKQIQMLQEQITKIQEQQNGLMAVKQIYKQEIRSLTRQNQQLKTNFEKQLGKLQQKLQNSQSAHNFEAVKQLFKKIIDSIGMMLHPSTSSQAKRKNLHKITEQKRKQAEECIKVICSILNYEQNVRNQLCARLVSGQ